MFEPSATDLKRLASKYGELRSKYEAIAPVRNKIAAHNVAASSEEITSLLKDAQLEVLDFVTYGLKGIVDDIHELYHNGTRPALEPAKATRREELLKSVRLALLPPSD